MVCGVAVPPSDIQDEICSLIEEFADIFSDSIHPLGVEVPPMPIRVRPDFVPAPEGPPRRYAPAVSQALTEEIESLLREGIIEEVTTEPAVDGEIFCPVVMVKKQPSGWRKCVDFRRLNSGLVLLSSPLASIPDILDKCGGNIYFARFDLLLKSISKEYYCDE